MNRHPVAQNIVEQRRTARWAAKSRAHFRRVDLLARLEQILAKHGRACASMAAAWVWWDALSDAAPYEAHPQAAMVKRLADDMPVDVLDGIDAIEYGGTKRVAFPELEAFKDSLAMLGYPASIIKHKTRTEIWVPYADYRKDREGRGMQ